MIQAYYARTGSPGDYQSGYDYEYDRVGNRIYEDAWSEYSETERFFTYDDANRLTGVDETATTYEDLSWEHILSQVENSHSYTWDSNGNLLFDGESYYQYDHASRLVSVSGPSSTVGYAYNGLGDRLQQTVDGATMTYTLDLNTGLTQVLTDGETTYLYGLARLAQENGSTSEYYLGDALGSVRQLIDGSGAVTYAASYTPYGEVLSSAGEGESEFGFTGEQVDATGLVYLRARYYSPYLNQFIQPDTIVPDPYIPADWHKYTYVRNNSINFTDPSGKSINLCLAAVFSPSNIPDNMTAGQLIGICQQFYTPTNWDFDCNYEWSKPEGVGGLFRDYVCEQGPDTVMFNGSDRLTRDLAYSIIIDRIRREYYKQGNRI